MSRASAARRGCPRRSARCCGPSSSGFAPGLTAQKLTTHAGMFTGLASALTGAKKPPFDFAVVDEAQDISVAHLRFLAALGAATA